MTGSPFVIFKQDPTKEIGSTPILIFGNDFYTCLLDGIELVNLTDSTIIVTLSMAREITVGVETDFTYRKQLVIQPYDSMDVQMQRAFTMEPGDLMYAFSDYSSNLFNAFVTYRILTELGATNVRNPH